MRDRSKKKVVNSDHDNFHVVFKYLIVRSDAAVL